MRRYKVKFPKLTKQLYENKRKLYNYSLIGYRLKHLRDNGAYIHEVNNPNCDGTLIEFEVADTMKEILKEYIRISWYYEIVKKL